MLSFRLPTPAAHVGMSVGSCSASHQAPCLGDWGDSGLGRSAGVPAAHVADLDGVPWLLDLAWLTPSCCSHLDLSFLSVCNSAFQTSQYIYLKKKKKTESKADLCGVVQCNECLSEHPSHHMGHGEAAGGQVTTSASCCLS